MSNFAGSLGIPYTEGRGPELLQNLSGVGSVVGVALSTVRVRIGFRIDCGDTSCHLMNNGGGAPLEPNTALPSHHYPRRSGSLLP